MQDGGKHDRLSQNITGRHFSHVTKCRIFKNLNLRKKPNRNFRGTFLEKRFRHLKLYSNPPDWPGLVIIWTPFEIQKIEVHLFEKANLSGFCTWNFTTKEDLNRRKQVLLLNFRPWPTKKPKTLSIFFVKILQRENQGLLV